MNGWYVVLISIATFGIGWKLGMATARAQVLEMFGLLAASQHEEALACPACNVVDDHAEGCPLSGVTPE